LLVDANTELPFAISAQRLKTIARQPQQIVPANRRFQNVQAAFGLVLESLKLPDAPTGCKTLCAPVAESLRNLWLLLQSHAL
jgi:hypothetical protein